LCLILISMSALAVAVPLMCVAFILRIAGPTNGMGAPFIVPSIAEIPCGKPSTRILPSPPAPPSPLAQPGPPADPTAFHVPVEVVTVDDCKITAPPLPPPPPPPKLPAPSPPTPPDASSVPETAKSPFA